MGLRHAPLLLVFAIAGCAGGSFNLTLPTGLLNASPAPGASVKALSSPSAVPSGTKSSSTPVAPSSGKATITYADSTPNGVSGFTIDLTVAGGATITQNGTTSTKSISQPLALQFFKDIHIPLPSPPATECAAARADLTTIAFDGQTISDQACSVGLPPGVADDLTQIESSLGLSSGLNPFPTTSTTPYASAAPSTPPSAQDLEITYYPPHGDPGPHGYTIEVTPDGQATYDQPGVDPMPAVQVPTDLLNRLFSDAKTPQPTPGGIHCDAVSSTYTTLTYGDNSFSSQICTGFWPDALAADVNELELLLHAISPSPTPLATPTATPTPLQQ